MSLDAVSTHSDIVSHPGRSGSYTLKIVGLSAFFAFPCSVGVGTRRNFKCKLPYNTFSAKLSNMAKWLRLVGCLDCSSRMQECLA